MTLERLYIVSQKRLKELLAAEAKLSALEDSGVDNWLWYTKSLNDYLDYYFDEHHDIINTWDEDDPRKEDFDFKAVASIEIQDNEFKRIDLQI